MRSLLSRLGLSLPARWTVDAQTASLAVASVILRRYGVLKIERLLDPDLAAAIGAAAKALYEERDARIAAGERFAASLCQSHRRRTLPLAEVMVDGRAAADMLDHPFIRELARLHLRRTPSLEPNSYVRTLSPGPHLQALPFHQDQAILRAPLLNVWIPLDDCGVHAPGLEVVVSGARGLLPIAGHPDHELPVERVRIDERVVVKTFGRGALWHPSLRRGDALAFAGTTVHRSYVTSCMAQPRSSVELRLV